MYKQYQPIILIFLLVFLVQNAFAQETFLRRNLPMHSTTIRRISTDAQGRYLLSGSNDKTAKLWDAHTGSLLQTYRVPMSQGNDGQLYAAALAPDARVVALGGWTNNNVSGNHSIYLLNRQTGQLLHRITGLSGVILDLEFSPDGRYLVAALGEAMGCGCIAPKTGKSKPVLRVMEMPAIISPLHLRDNSLLSALMVIYGSMIPSFNYNKSKNWATNLIPWLSLPMELSSP
jgi:WD40 repeat protein